MNRRDFLKTAGLTAAVFAVPGSFEIAESSKAPRRKFPNIVYIMADDLGYGDVGCYNPQSKIPTPNIDAFAKTAVTFTNVHSPSAVCTPTRYGVLTGRYCWRTRLKKGVLDGFSQPLFEKNRLTLPGVLQRNGYNTACIGKWHLGIDWQTRDGKPAESFDDWQRVDFKKRARDCPNEHGFDYSFITAACSTVDPPYVFIENGRCTAEPTDWMERTGRVTYFASREGPKVPGWSNEDVDTTYVKKTRQFMERHKTEHKDKPFFIYLPLSAPHAPWQPPDFIQGKSDEGPRGDLVALVDWCVGQVLDDLDRLGLSENTIVIFTSDNGPRVGGNGHKSAGNLRGYKSNIWEGGHRVPFIARRPGVIKAGGECDELMCLTDLMATFTALVGDKLPDNAGEDSFNMLHIFNGDTSQKPVRDSVVSHSSKGVFSIQHKNWKLIFDTKGSGGWVGENDRNIKPGSDGQLYDIKKDPYETNDLWDQRPDVVEELKELLNMYKKQGYSRPLERNI